MESPHGFDVVHWDHEPRQLVGRGVLTAPRLGGLGTARPTLRFMESPLTFFRMHWDHEPADRAAASWTAPVLWRFRLARLHRQSARRLAHSKTWRGFQWFMESPTGFFQPTPTPPRSSP